MGNDGHAAHLQEKADPAGGRTPSAVAVSEAEPEILAFGLMEIVFRVMIDIFGYPESLAVFVDNTIDTLAVVAGNVIFLRNHRYPFVNWA